MGNADYMLNIGILVLNNMNMFSKLYRRGFQHSLREFNVLGNAKDGYRSGSTWWKGLGNAKDGYRSGSTWWKGLAKGVKNSLSEGAEEYLQRAASEGAGNIANKSLSEYIDATKEYKSNYDTWDTIGSFAKSIADNADDP